MISVNNEIRIRFGRGTLMMEYHPVGLRFIELNKKFKVGEKIEDNDWINCQTGRDFLLNFTHTQDIHLLYLLLSNVSRKHPRFEYQGAIFDFYRCPKLKEAINTFKNAIRSWISTKANGLEELYADGLYKDELSEEECV